MSNRFSANTALDAIAESVNGRYGVLLKRGSLEIGFYKPDGVDPQHPHEQNEVYVVQSGEGSFVLDNHHQPFEAGDALFVPAGVAHRFEDFSSNFAAWVIFYGPEGGD